MALSDVDPQISLFLIFARAYAVRRNQSVSIWQSLMDKPKQQEVGKHKILESSEI